MNPLEHRQAVVHRLPTAPTPHDVVQVEDVARLLQLLHRHRFRLIGALLITTLAATAYYATSKRVYQSEARLMIVRKDPLTVESMPSVVPRGADAMSTHIALIKSPWLASRVLHEDGLQELATFREQETPVAVLLKSLEVVHQRDDHDLRYSDSNVLFFQYSGPDPAECPVVLAAVIDEYRQHLNEANRAANQDAAALLQEKVAQIQLRLKENEREYEEHRASIPGRSSREQELHFGRQRIANIDASQVELEVRQAEATSRLEALRELEHGNPSATRVKALLPDASDEQQAQALNEMILPLVAEAQRIVRASRMGVNHPRVVALEEQIASIRTIYESQEMGDPRFEAGPNRRGASAVGDTVAAHRVRIEQELKDIESAQESLEAEARRAQEQVRVYLALEQAEEKRLAEAQVRSERFQKDIGRDQQLLNALQSQLQRVEIDIVSGAYATTLLAPPSNAVVASPKTALVFAASTFLGIGLGIAWIFVAELRQRLARMAEPAEVAPRGPLLSRQEAASEMACSM